MSDTSKYRQIIDAESYTHIYIYIYTHIRIYVPGNPSSNSFMFIQCTNGRI